MVHACLSPHAVTCARSPAEPVPLPDICPLPFHLSPPHSFTLANRLLAVIQSGNLTKALVNTTVGAPVLWSNLTALSISYTPALSYVSGSSPIFSVLANQGTPLLAPCRLELADASVMALLYAAWAPFSALLKANWTGDPCTGSWQGISCQLTAPQRLVGINLNHVSLVGATIPTSIGQLYKLTTLDLSNTGIGGSLPSQASLGWCVR